MDVWEEWNLSTETENRLNVICSKIDTYKLSEISKIWVELSNYGSPPIPSTSVNEMELNFNEVEPKEDEILNIIKEALETNTPLPESKLVGISYSTLTRILLSLSDLSEKDFSSFCKFITSWSNTALVEESLRLIVLPKLKIKKEASACTIFSIKELAISKPDILCHSVLIPLLSEESFQFTDAELLSQVFYSLEPALRDLLILTLTKKKDFQETDWLLLQPLVKDLSQNSSDNIINIICKFSDKFSKSQVFGRFLLNFCKNLYHVSNKCLLLEAIDKHQTLFKKQARKCLDSI